MRELFLGEEEVIVSKTDTKGLITYANDVFCRIAGYSATELLGVPHSIVRHPDMPRCVFKFMWDRIAAGHEIFAYVKNMARSGDYYWVLAHVTPTFSSQGEIIGYHSNRRCPARAGISAVEPLYRQLCAVEEASDPRTGLDQSLALLVATLNATGLDYDEFIFQLI
ncbi:MAG: PAS domain-containing protein [Fimbriimonadaceae bacterium]|jgi:PAS domain S-box-containing protein|nr:PAS domain-containing protein [Fimbriimonadaceae bacterium]